MTLRFYARPSDLGADPGNHRGKAIGIKARSWLDPFLSDEGKPRIVKGAGPLVAEEGLEPPTRGL